MTGPYVVENTDGLFVASFATELLARFFVEEGTGHYRFRTPADAQGEAVERILAMTDEEIVATSMPADLAWAEGYKRGLLLALNARSALEWYGEQARLCRLIHSEGDAGRHALSDDGGKRAAAALAALQPTQQEISRGE